MSYKTEVGIREFSDIELDAQIKRFYAQELELEANIADIDAQIAHLQVEREKLMSKKLGEVQVDKSTLIHEISIWAKGVLEGAFLQSDIDSITIRRTDEDIEYDNTLIKGRRWLEVRYVDGAYSLCKLYTFGVYQNLSDLKEEVMQLALAIKAGKPEYVFGSFKTVNGR